MYFSEVHSERINFLMESLIVQGMDLKIKRIRAGWKQWELASELGINQNRLSQFELGRRPIPAGLAGQIKKILNEARITRAKPGKVSVIENA